MLKFLVGKQQLVGVAGAAVGGIFDIIDIGIQANTLVKCQQTKNCTDREIRDCCLVSDCFFYKFYIAAAVQWPNIVKNTIPQPAKIGVYFGVQPHPEICPMM